MNEYTHDARFWVFCFARVIEMCKKKERFSKRRFYFSDGVQEDNII